MKVYILGLEDSLASSIINLADVLSMANGIENPGKKNKSRINFDVRIASADGEPVPCRHGILLVAHCTFDDIKQADIIILPALMNIDDIIKKHKKLIQLLIKKHQEGVIVGTVF